MDPAPNHRLISTRGESCVSKSGSKHGTQSLTVTGSTCEAARYAFDEAKAKLEVAQAEKAAANSAFADVKVQLEVAEKVISVAEIVNQASPTLRAAASVVTMLCPESMQEDLHLMLAKFCPVQRKAQLAWPTPLVTDASRFSSRILAEDSAVAPRSPSRHSTRAPCKPATEPTRATQYSCPAASVGAQDSSPATAVESQEQAVAAAPTSQASGKGKGVFQTIVESLWVSSDPRGGSIFDPACVMANADKVDAGLEAAPEHRSVPTVETRYPWLSFGQSQP